MSEATSSQGPTEAMSGGQDCGIPSAVVTVEAAPETATRITEFRDRVRFALLLVLSVHSFTLAVIGLLAISWASGSG